MQVFVRTVKSSPVVLGHVSMALHGSPQELQTIGKLYTNVAQFIARRDHDFGRNGLYIGPILDSTVIFSITIRLADGWPCQSVTIPNLFSVTLLAAVDSISSPQKRFRGSRLSLLCDRIRKIAANLCITSSSSIIRKDLKLLRSSAC